jgi:hypothetical protein
MSHDEAEMVIAGEAVIKQIGALGHQVEELDQLKQEISIEPEDVGSWITVIGKALLAIFKP